MEFEFRQIDIQYLDEIFKMQEEVFDEGYDQTILRYHTKDVLEKALNQHSITLGVFYQNKLAGFIMLEYYDALDMDMKLVNKIETSTPNNIYTIYLIIVKKEYRGYGLQQKMLNIIEKNVKNTIINATVSPLNSYSLNNFLKCGYKILTEKKMYGGYNRMIVYKLIN